MIQMENDAAKDVTVFRLGGARMVSFFMLWS